MATKLEQLMNSYNKTQNSKKSKLQQMVEKSGYELDDNGNIIVDLTVETNNGKKNFGKVTYDAYKAIRGNTLDSYKPKNEEEKKVIGGYKQYTGMFNPINVKSNYDKNKFGNGNIDLTDRPLYVNEDGTISTVNSISFNEDGKEILVPTIVKDNNGNIKKLTDEQAIEHYHKTGEYLGKFDTIEEANKYAQKLHMEQDTYYSNSVPLAIEIEGKTKDFGKISVGAYDAIINNKLEGYKPKNEEEKKAIAEYTTFAEAYAKKQREPENFGQGVLHSIGYTAENLGAGVLGGVESVGRFVKAIGATALRPFTWGSWNQANKDAASDALSEKMGSEYWKESIESRYRVPDWYRNNVGNAIYNVGTLLPAIAAEVATYSASPLLEAQLALKAASLASKGSLATKIATKLIKPKVSDLVFGASAAGSSASSAYRETGDLVKSLNYGILNGLGEVATEKLFGGIGGTGIGADEAIDVGKYLNKIKGVSKLASTKYGKKVLDMAFEGVEEMIMTDADPWFQKLTINPDAEINHAFQSKFWKDRGEAFTQGVLLSGIMNASTATFNKLNNIKNKVKIINDLNDDVEKLNSTLPKEAPKLEPLKLNATEKEIEQRYSDIQRVALIKVTNGGSDAINAILKDDESKLAPLSYDSAIDEIKQRQKEVSAFGTMYADLMADEIVKSNPETFANIEKATVGDKYLDLKSGNKFTVVNRDDEKTTVEIETPKGTIARVFPNSQADNFATSERLIAIEDTSPVAENETTEETSTVDTPQAKNKGVNVGDIYRNNKSNVLYTIVSRNETTTTVRNGLNSTLETMSNATADFLFNNTDTTKGDTFIKIQNGTTTGTTDNVTPAETTVTEAEISAVVDAMNDTLADGALEVIYESIPSHLDKSLDVFASQLIRLYKKTGTIGHIAQYFTDGGKKVVDAIEGKTDVVSETKPAEKTKAETVETVAESTEQEVVAKNATTEENSVVETPTNAKNITLTKVNDTYEAYGEDARVIADALDLVTVKKVVDGVETDTIKMPSNFLEGLAEELGEDYKLTVADDTTTTEAETSTTAEETTTTNEEATTNVASENKSTNEASSKGQKKKIIRAKKSDWASHDVCWYAPNSKTIIAYSTRAASDLVETMAEDNPKMTISELRDAINYDVEAKKVLQAYINSGFGDSIASEHFVHNKSKITDSEAKTEATETESVKEVTEETIEEKRNNIREKAAKTGEINLDELGTLTGIPVTHMSKETDTEKSSKAELSNETNVDNDVDNDVDNNDNLPFPYEEVLQNQSESDTIEENNVKESVENVHERVLDRESGNDSTVRKSEPVQEVEEERNIGTEDREFGEDVVGENGTHIQSAETETPSTEQLGGRVSDNGIRESDNSDGDSGVRVSGNDNVNDEVTDDVKDDENVKESKAKDYSITKAVAEELDTKAPNIDDNIKAIETLHELENSGKAPTKTQQSILAKFKGWGGLSNAFWQARSRLKEIMSDSEISEAQSTVNDAYFTPTSIIDSIYKGLNHLGFEGGNILEPSMGVGNFFGRMPKSIKDISSLFGVEIDTISGKIAQYLYPSANIEIAPFQDVAYKDGSFDLIIGNVPFGEVKYKYKNNKYLIHDYFFVKAMDKLNDGGIMVFLTSKGTLDKLDSTTRAELNRQGNIIGAYRLPSNVFSRSAGANVVTDLIIMQKTTNNNGEKFVNTGNVKLGNENFSINEYFVNHPENIIGELTYRRGQYGKYELTVQSTGDVAEQLTKAIRKLPKNLLSGVETVGTTSVMETSSQLQTFYINDKGNVEYVDAQTGEVKVLKNTIKSKNNDIAKEYLAIKKAYTELTDYTLNDVETSSVESKRQELNALYDDFVNKYGTLEKNKKLLSADNDFYKLSGLEVYDTKTKKIIKSEMFTKDTIGKRKPKKADNVLDALSISMGESGSVNLKRISELTNLPQKEVIEQLSDRIIYTPEGTFELNEVYLSGNVREKYEAVKGKKGFEKNEQMLKAVIPENIPAKNITPQFGASWISPKYVAEFLRETFQLRGTPKVIYDSVTGTWSISGNTWGDTTLMLNKYGTKYLDAVQLAEKALNMRQIVVKNKDGQILGGETKAAQQKALDIKNAFEEWCFKDADRRNDLVETFNKLFNSNRNMDFTELSKYLTFNGLSDTFELRDYQKRAVARGIFNGNTLLAHGVGTGKTAEMITIAMELKRMGMAKKNMMVVPPHKVTDFRNDILKMYPSAKVAYLEKGANATQRQRFYAQVAANDFDIVIIPHSSFGLLDVSKDTKIAFINNQLAELEEVLTAAQLEKGSIDGRFIRQLENQKKRLEEKMKFITESKKDNGNTFEELGVDSLFVDEAHNFKNLPFYTKLSRVAGVSAPQNNNKDRASRAENMFMITDYLNRNKGRITFGTATPITKSISEIYTMTRFLRPDILRDSGLQSFDAWASMFGSIVNKAETKPSGRGMRMKERFSKFRNVSQMIEQFRRFADILKSGEVIADLPVAERINVINPSNEIQEEFLDRLDEIISDIQTNGARSEYNMLQVTKAGEMAALDLRMVASYFDGKYTLDDLNLPSNRTSQVAERVYKEYTESNATKGTQFVFCDAGVYDNPNGTYGFHIYGDLINKLVAYGIPRNEIAVAQEFEDKSDLSAKVNTGEIRVLIGSTAVMGEGMNAQNKAVALHHMTIPDNPAGIEQREGRIIRYGNENKNVRIYRYIQESSYDSYKWQMQERKADIINQALSGGTIEELEEMSDFQLSAREAKAIASGNPLLLEKIEVEDKVNNLKTLRKKFNTDKLEMQERLATLPNRIRIKEKLIEDTKADIKTIEANQTKDFIITLGKTKYTERAKAAEALERGTSKIPKNGNVVKIGSYRGLDLFYCSSVAKGTEFILEGARKYTVMGGDSALGNVTRLINLVEKIPENLSTDEALVKKFKSEVSTLEKEVNNEFPQEKELQELETKLNEIDTALGINAGAVDMSDVFVDEDTDDTDVENVQYSIESEELSDEQRESLLFGNSDRGSNESTRKQTERISKFKQKNKVKTRAERQSFAKELLAKGQTEEIIDGRDKYNLVKPEAYNDDMLSIVEKAKANGKEVGFFIGEGKLKFDTKGEFLVNGIKVTDNKILLRYDGRIPPQLLYKHEHIHTEWDTDEVQGINRDLSESLTEEEKQKIFEQDRYTEYLELYEGDKDAVWQEFVCDVMAGMNEYSIKYIDTVMDYWYGQEFGEGYSPSTYAESIDAGGINEDVRKYSFGGEKAVLSNNSNLEEAKRLIESGNGKEFVFEKTGWFRGGDGHWRFEIDDSKAEFSFEKLKDGATLAEILNHKELYKFYPFLKDVNVKCRNFGDDSTQLGEYDPNTNTISITDEVLDSDMMEHYDILYKSVLLHEVQHAIQIYEGFEVGATPAFMETYLREQAMFELVDINDVRFNQIIKQGTIEDLNNYVDAYIKNEFKTESVKEAAEKAYLLLHGEKEAYSVGDRFELSAEERAKTYPNFSKGAILLNDNKKRNINYRISKTSGETSESKFIENLYSDFRRRMEEKAGVSNSQIPQKNIKYSLATDGIPDLEDLWNGAIDEYGAIPKGEKPARDIDVPQRISPEKVVSRFARTMLEAGVTPDWAVSEFEQAILDGDMTHEVITNKNAREWAIKQIEYHGFEDALNQWYGFSATGEVGKRELALGMELYNQCVTNRDVHNAMKIAADLAAEATNAGQTLQACRMLKLMSPDGQLYYLEKSIQKMNEEFRDKLGDKFKDIELDESLMEDFFNETDEEERNAIYDDICQDIADQIPATFKDKWNSWRYLAMLGNPRTHMRNILGNAVFVPSIRMKNYIGAVIEKMAKVDASERTKSFDKSEEAIEFAENDFKEMIKVLQGENAKYAVTSDIEGKRTIFKTEWLEKARLKNFEFLEKEDMWFLKMHYVDALARLITVRNVDVKSIDSKTLERIRVIAIKEAQAATYRDANSIAEGLNALQKKLGRSHNKVLQSVGILIEGVMPFTKTPMNIAKQGINYSPIGILKGTYKAFSKLKNGNATTTEVIDDFAKGLTGTGMMLLGLLLAKLGILIGAGDKPDKEKEFDKMVGEQDYSINIGDWSYTIDWAAPSNLALFIGAELYNLTKDEFSFADIVSAVSTISEPLLELSVFNGVNGVIESAQYSEGSPLLAIGYDMATSYFMQALPTIGGQLSRIIDSDKKEYYYVDKNKDIPKGMQRLIGQASSKIPFASYLFKTAVDEWGREETYGNILERVGENTISPGYYSKENYTYVDKVLKDLYEKTGETAVLPISQQKYYEENYIRYDMTAEEYAEAKKTRGQKSFKYVTEVINNKKTVKLQNKETGHYQNKLFKNMSDEEKVRAIKKCYEQAGEETKETMLEKMKQRKSK